MRTQFWHNPACSKSRAALALLEHAGVDLQVVHYLDTPPDADALGAVCDRLGIAPHALLRAGEPEYMQLGADPSALDAPTVLAAMARHPRLIERPVFIHAGRAVIGRPPERVLDLLDPPTA